MTERCCYAVASKQRAGLRVSPIVATGDSRINEASVISRGYSKAAPSPKPRRYKDVESVFGQLKAISGSEVVLKGRLLFGSMEKILIDTFTTGKFSWRRLL